MTRQATQRQSAVGRARELRDGLLALRREQGLLVAELVWNEMRAKEIRLRLEAPPSPLPPIERSRLAQDLHRRIELIRSLARWEADADRSYRRQRELLAALVAADPELATALPDCAELLGARGLEAIARAAARELGLSLDGGVDDC